jgi:hypothetical protein
MRYPLEQIHSIVGLLPVADAFTGTVATDVFTLKEAASAVVQVIRGDGTTGTGTGTAVITVEACDNNAAANPVAIPFRYRQVVSPDTPGAIIEVAAAGFTWAAGENRLIEVEIEAVELAKLAKAWVRVKSVEAVDDPYVGASMIALHGLRFSRTTGSTYV